VPLQARQVDGALTAKGFKKVDNDHHFYFLYHNGKKTVVRTKISHGEREISDKNCGHMARQMQITTPQFKEFVDCKIENKDYVDILIKNGVLERPPSS
jgi:hypothetical protein